jgi:protein-L-isoaspartate(D-aspartate) O-methyltransferase
MLFKSKDKTGIDYAELREQMVERQIARRDVTDRAVLDAMRTVPRHLFVPDELRHDAYEDGPLPIGHGQTISQPYVVASMTQNLELSYKSKVLEIGTGSGYQAAVLAEIAKEVYSVEIVPELLSRAQGLFEVLHYRNIEAKLGDGSLGWPEHGPYNAIIVTAAAPRIPEALVEQLAPGGVMVLPLRENYDDTQDLIKVRRTPDGLKQISLYAVRFVPMRGDVDRHSTK